MLPRLKITNCRSYFSKLTGGTQSRKMSQPLAAISGGENIPGQPAKMQKMEEKPLLRVKKLSENATLPVRGSSGAAGYDLARCVSR